MLAARQLGNAFQGRASFSVFSHIFLFLQNSVEFFSRVLLILKMLLEKLIIIDIKVTCTFKVIWE